MGREVLTFPESWMAEIIEVIEAGSKAGRGFGLSQDVDEMLKEWCEEHREYAKQYDRRRIRDALQSHREKRQLWSVD